MSLATSSTHKLAEIAERVTERSHVDILFAMILRRSENARQQWVAKKHHDGSESTGGKLQEKIRRPQAVAGTAATVLCNWCAMRNLLSRRKKEKPGAQNSEQGVNILTWIQVRGDYARAISSEL